MTAKKKSIDAGVLDYSLRPRTPYDTGERLEPVPWVRSTAKPRNPMEHATEDYGKVDFDNDESATVATLWIERQPDGTYVLKGYTNEPLKVEIEEQL